MILENRNSVKISDMPNEIRSVSIGIEHLKFFILKVLINSTKSYIVKIKTIELAIFLISIISIFIAVIFLTVQRYGKGSIPPNSIGIKLQKTL